MDKKEYRSAVLFEYERISDHIMDIGYGAVLKMVVDLGFKDSSNHKRRSYEEYRYRNPSKYNNTDYLISASRKAEYYLKIEYPRSIETNGNRKGAVIIRPYSVLGFVDILKEFDDVVFNPYKDTKDGNIHLIEKEIKTVRSSPTSGSLIEFSHGQYIGKDGKLDYGVHIGINEEFYITVRTTTVWKQLYYHMTKCDLYLWGSTLLAPYTTKLIGGAVSELGGGYNSTRRYEVTYEPDPEDAVRINEMKPITKKDKVKSFFDD